MSWVESAFLTHVWIVATAGLGLLALSAATRTAARWLSAFSLLFVALAVVAAIASHPGDLRALVFSSLQIDALGNTAHVLCGLATLAALATALVAPAAVPAVAREWPGLLLLVSAASMLAASASSLPTLLVAVEAAGLGMNVLLGLGRNPARGAEVSTKAFLTGAASVGLLVFGAALVYAGSDGALDHEALRSHIERNGPSAVGAVGVLMMVSGLAFRIGVAPFHMALPDFVEGAPLPAALFYVSGFRLCLLVATARLLGAGFFDPALTADGSGLAAALVALAGMSLLVGTLGALRQDGVKRMIGYLSIAQLGWAFVALAAASQHVPEAGFAFAAALLGAVPALVGALLVTAYLPEPIEGRAFMDDWAGLGRQRPGLALAMSICLFSLVGLPLTAGFVSLLSVMKVAFTSRWLLPLEIFALVCLPAGSYAALRLVVTMYFREGQRIWSEEMHAPVSALLWVCVASVVLFGIVPAPWLAWVRWLSPRF